ncbi:MAG TPA: ABC transporter, partial [Gemmiger formicilis]|nr:ABC transporter [Gemmiger formicilis]
MKKLNVKLPQGGSKRALHRGMYASALAVLAVIILVNLVIRALPTKYTEYDISTTSLFTLSDTTENLLHELNADVTAYYLAESGQEDANITRLLDRYAG